MTDFKSEVLLDFTEHERASTPAFIGGSSAWQEWDSAVEKDKISIGRGNGTSRSIAS
jgi:hypothetical protein